MFSKILLIALSAALTGCSQYSEISARKPVFNLTASSATPWGERILRADKGGQPDALGSYLSAAADAANQLRVHPSDGKARDSYNYAVARIFTSLRRANADPWTKPLAVPGEDGGFTLEGRRDSRKNWNPELYRFIPADEISMKGTYVTEHMRKDGIGAPLVAVGKEGNSGYAKDFGLPKTYYGVTAIARFEGHRCIMEFHDPLAEETLSLNGRVFPLAADFTVPIAVMLAETNPKKLELARLLRPQKYAETARIARLQPYDPNKTVVLVIHGLKDSQATWAPMINSLRADEMIRKNYQFWFFSYPSGYPYPYSAAILRKQLDAAEAHYQLKKKMVVIGHSMGGCISRLLITDTGDRLWIDYFGKPPGKTNLTPTSQRFLEDALIFRHRSEVGRVIFISAPLKGSDLASGWPGRIGSWLIKAPFTFLDIGKETVKAVATGGDTLKIEGLPNSVDTLAPNNRFVKAINEIPLTPGIPYHTIMGDRGKGGNHDHTKPVQTDGIVPYWSSHMPGAQSELVVPSHHSAHQNSQAIREVDRILRQHIGS